MKVKKAIKTGILCTVFAAVAGGIADLGLHRLAYDRKPLTPEQIESLRPVFGDDVDYSSIRIADGPMSIWQKEDKYMTFGHTIFRPRHKISGQLESNDLLAHEVMHVWQQKKHGLLKYIFAAAEICGEYPVYEASYAYDIETGTKLSHYNIEQQGDIVRDYLNNDRSIRNEIASIPEKYTWDNDISMIESSLIKWRKLQQIVSSELSMPRDTSHIAAFHKSKEYSRIDQKMMILHARKSDIPEKVTEILDRVHKGKDIIPCYFRDGIDDMRQSAQAFEDSTGFELYDHIPDSATTTAMRKTLIRYNNENVLSLNGPFVTAFKPGNWTKKLDSLHRVITAKEKDAYTTVRTPKKSQ